MKSCICSQERDESEERFSTFAINHYCGLFIISLYFTCHDFNVRLKLRAFIKSRAKLKTA